MPVSPAPRSPLALVVLGLLAERPMHPYLMFQLIQQREKTSIVNVSQRNSLYQVINRLVKAGLAAPDTTEREANRPERTVYRITDDGTETVHRWLREMLATDNPEFPQFAAALSMLALLSPDDAQKALTARLEQLDAKLRTITGSLAYAASIGLPRLFLLDDDYRLTLLRAEIAWVKAQVTALAAGDLTWSAEWIANVAATFEPPPA
ncbi:PadR family transcriptional regulator [Subtercola lobariae]|uniref:PadR family transcriptional regulator n=1 Tax=Subtercola lobariae TaxID=1588641 RepID=A0A917AZM9_9MICO|nr:PadR family transcriptional regulator [Subtercola lobariae]GGF13120.1 PadR family transcriptional regulator [Subtercola lobariae]